MKNIVMILPCLFWVLLGNAQTEGRPYWIDNLPTTKENSKYYYRVTLETARTMTRHTPKPLPVLLWKVRGNSAWKSIQATICKP